jgi:PEP-CTERM motif
MKIVVPALAAAFIATVGASSAAQAAVIDFGVDAITGADLSYTGPSLNASTAFDFDGSPLAVTSKGAGDASGLVVLSFPTSPDMFVSLSPTDIVYDMGTLASPVTKSWTGSTGDMFTETLTSVKSINRATADAITVVLTGTVTDTDGLFKGSPVKFIMQANQVGGPGDAITASFTNVSSVPEPATWVMLALGFAGLGYAAVRRSAKDKAAIAV